MKYIKSQKCINKVYNELKKIIIKVYKDLTNVQWKQRIAKIKRSDKIIGRNIKKNILITSTRRSNLWIIQNDPHKIRIRHKLDKTYFKNNY